jgi:multidrug resistance efflux pump
MLKKRPALPVVAFVSLLSINHVFSSCTARRLQNMIQVSGQVKSLKVKTGDRVTKGQLIACINDVPQRNDLRNERGQCRSAG